MKKTLSAPVRAESLCRQLGLKLLGPDRSIHEVSSLDCLEEHGLSFVRDGTPGAEAAGTVFAPDLLGGRFTVIQSAAPRLDFIRAQHLLKESPGFAEDSRPPDIHPTARIAPNALIENGVSIGEGTRVEANAVIRSGTRIGRSCEIQTGAVIGETGFGFERDAQGHPLRMIHLGGVVLGDFVEIGTRATVCRGALSDTVLEDYVKVQGRCHVSHNCVIGEGTIINACGQISGSVRIGKKVWLGANCSIVQKVRIGDGAFIGPGTVVTRRVSAGVRLIGNPGRPPGRPPSSPEGA